MWSDNETNIDFLNHSEVADIIGDMLSDDSLMPLSIGIYGGWGAGKSSILKLIEANLEQESNTIIIEFDAWLYQGFDEAKSALMTVIANSILNAAPNSFRDKALNLFKRVNKLKLLGICADIGLTISGIPTLGGATKAISSLQNMAAGNGGAEDLESIKGTFQENAPAFSSVINDKEIKSAPEEIAAFKREFSELLVGMNKKIVVFVDNLDRCLPQTAIKNLEAMRLFLSLPQTAFLVAADVDMIRHAVADQFGNASEKHINDYLDKLIQFPVSVPRLGLLEVQAYLLMLIATKSDSGDIQVELLREYVLERIRSSWSNTTGISEEKAIEILAPDQSLTRQISTAFRIAPILAHSNAVAGNPRIIKRMMNVIRMRHATAQRRNMALDEAVITKISLFERCTNEAAFLSLLQLVNASSDGKVTLLAPDELAKGIEGNEQFPETWKQFPQVIRDWGELAPDLSKVDLRPAVYLARETLPLRIKHQNLSAHSVVAIQELKAVATTASKAAKELVAKIPPEEVLPVLSELIVVMRQNSHWESKRADLNGPMIIAKRSPEAKAKLISFLKEVPTPKPWLSFTIDTILEAKE